MKKKGKGKKEGKHRVFCQPARKTISNFPASERRVSTNRGRNAGFGAPDWT